MAGTKKSKETVDKIKVAARKVFLEKGFAATKTRDIAEEAGINIASLHYHFRDKDSLFEIIIKDAFANFTKLLNEIFSTENTKPFKAKIEHFVVHYTEFLKANPYVPTFLFSELQRDPDKIKGMVKDIRINEDIQKELKEMTEKGMITPVDHANFLTNMMGLTVFPFLARPIIMFKTGIDDAEFLDMLEKRKKLVPEITCKSLGLE